MKDKITDKVLKSIGKRIERKEFGHVELAHIKKILKNIPDFEFKPLMVEEEKRREPTMKGFSGMTPWMM